MPCSMFSEKKRRDYRLIWLIFHEDYKGGEHLWLFRLFVLSQYYTPWMSCCASMLHVHDSHRQFQDKALVVKRFAAALFVTWGSFRCAAPVSFFPFCLVAIPRNQFMCGVTSLYGVLITANRFVLISWLVLFCIS